MNENKVEAALGGGQEAGAGDNADIAKEFSISENTVKHTITAIFAKLGATTRAEAAAIAHRKHLVDA